MIDFCREIEVVFGPLKEWEKNEGKAPLVRILSDGTPKTLRVRAQVSKTMLGVPNSSSISIWNLSRETRNSICQSQLNVQVYAGYKGQKKELLFAGGILSVVVEKNGPDIITHLNGLDGQSNLLRSVVSQSFDQQIELKEVIKKIAAGIDGVNVKLEDIKIDGKTGYSGIVASGNARAVLDKLGQQYGFNWFIENGNFKAVGDKQAFSNTVVLDGASRLKKVSPLLSGPAQAQIGVDIQAMYVPGVSPGNSIKVQSSVNPLLNGTYKIHNADFDLDTKSESWDMNLQCYTVGL